MRDTRQYIREHADKITEYSISTKNKHITNIPQPATLAWHFKKFLGRKQNQHSRKIKRALQDII